MWHRITPVLATLGIAVFAACGGSNDGDSSPGFGAGLGANGDNNSNDSGRSGFGAGSARLTIGDRTFEFEGYRCAFGHEATRSDYSFSSTAFTEVDGHRAQLLVDVWDEEERGRHEGEGVFYEVGLEDVTDFDDPLINIVMVSLWAYRAYDQALADVDDPAFVRISGNRVTAGGYFWDYASDQQIDYSSPIEPQLLRGTFEGECGQGSRR